MDFINDFDFEESTDIFFEDSDNNNEKSNNSWEKSIKKANNPNISVEDNFKAAYNALTDDDKLSAPSIKNGLNNPELFSNIDAGVSKVSDSINRTFGTAGNATMFSGVRRSLVQFPIYISRSLDITSASLLAKYLEIYYAAIFQQMLSLNQYISMDQANNLSFLSAMHTNIREYVDVINSDKYSNYVRNPFYQPINEMDEMIQNGFSNEIPLTENTSLIFRILPSDDEDMNFESRRMARDPFEGLSYLKENDNIREPKSFVDKITDTTQKEYLSKIDAQELNSKIVDIARNLKNNNNKYKNDDSATVQSISEEILKRIKNNEYPGYAYHDGEYFTTKTKSSNKQISTINSSTFTPVGSPSPPQILRDNDVKKINGLAPYRMSVTFRVALPNGGVDRDITFVIGVKSLLRSIDASDITDDLFEIVTGNSKTLQKIRYKSGEISLADYLFDIKGIKKDAARNLNYNQKWVTTLKRLADGSKLGNTFLQPAVDLLQGGEIPIPNATLIFTDSDVNNLKNTTGVDLNELRNATSLCNALFLVSFIIVTPGTSTMKILTPTNFNDWEYQSLKTLQDEVGRAENSELNKAIQKAINN